MTPRASSNSSGSDRARKGWGMNTRCARRALSLWAMAGHPSWRGQTSSRAPPRPSGTVARQKVEEPTPAAMASSTFSGKAQPARTFPE